MTVYTDVARYHLIQRVNYLILPWALLAFVFGLNMFIIAAIAPAGQDSRHDVGGLASVFVLMFVLGVQSVARSLPFGLALGLSRRSYYLGTTLLAVALSAAVAVVITVAQAVERGTGGWGVNLGFFRVPYILSGAWYLTLLTSFVGLTLLFVYGMWFGLVYRRWSLVGLLAFAAGQVTVLTVAALAVTSAHGWHAVGHFFTTLSAVGLTGVLAAVTVVLVAGGFTTMRRLTV
jgi:hypothetical protein